MDVSRTFPGTYFYGRMGFPLVIEKPRHSKSNGVHINQRANNRFSSLTYQRPLAEATGTTGLAVVDQCNRVNRAMLAEQFGDFVFGRAEGQVAHVQFLQNISPSAGIPA